MRMVRPLSNLEPIRVVSYYCAVNLGTPAKIVQIGAAGCFSSYTFWNGSFRVCLIFIVNQLERPMWEAFWNRTRRLLRTLSKTRAPHRYESMPPDPDSE